MSREISLQRRLGIGLAIGVSLLWMAATVAAGLIVRHELDEAFDSALQETAQRILPLAVADILRRRASDPPGRVPSVREHEEYLTYLVRDRAGRVLMRSHDAEEKAFPELPARGYRNTETHRVYGEAAVRGTIIIEVAEPLEHRREASREAAVALFGPLLLLIPLSFVGVWWFVRRSMRPVLTLRTSVETRSASDLTPVATTGLPAEIAPVAEAVNALMARLRRSLETERNFAANSAHELRTPIAAALAQVQRLVVECPEGRIRDRAEHIEVSLQRLARVVEKLMQLARAEGGGLLTEQIHDLRPVLAAVLDEFRQEARQPGRLIFRSDGSTLASHIDPDAFAVLMRNLIENALKHGAADEPVVVSVSPDGTLRVSNGGPTVPPERLAQLKQRFQRGPTTALGSGLGLAIADAITVGAGGRLRLVSPASGSADGFEAEIVLPPPMTPGMTDVDNPGRPRSGPETRKAP